MKKKIPEHRRDEEAAFWKAIDADPEDDTARLVFADWLQERDDPRAADVRARIERVKRIREKLPRLKAADTKLEYFAAHSHKYELQPPLPPATVRKLEAKCGVRLPDDYFEFVVRIAEAGAGPSYGINPVRKVFSPDLGTFPITDTGDPDPDAGFDTDDEVGGCFLLAEHGCATDAYLVVAGAEAGKVWVFAGGGDGLWHPMRMQFLEWYEGWLDEGLRQFSPEKKRRRK